jgi:hypothetical protein
MRDEFRAIVSGWTLTSDVEDLGEYIEETARFVTANGPLEPDEERTVAFMIECQVARGIKRGDFAPFIVTAGKSYMIVEGGRAIYCLTCGMTSHNPHDVENRYCGNCHKFHEDEPQ